MVAETVFFLRIMGVICVVGGSASVGFQFAADKKRRLEELKYGKKVLALFRGEINYHHAALPEAFLALGGRVREPYARFLKELGQTLYEQNGQPFLTLYSKTMEKNLRTRTALSKNDLEKLTMFAEQLGYLDREAQVAQTDLLMEQLSQTITEEEENYHKNSRLYRCLGVMGGLILALILV